MPQDGDLGTAPDGTPVMWNAQLGRAVPVSQGATLAKAATAGVGSKAFSGVPQTRPGGPRMAPVNALMQSPIYGDRRARNQADADEAWQKQNNADIQEGEAAVQSTKNLRETVRQAPTGSFAKVRQSLGKNIGNWAGGLPFVPTFEEATALENLGTQTAERTLGDVSKLKGPMSDKDVVFLGKLQVDPYGSKAHNKYVADMQSWAADRKKQYALGQKAWARELGSPDATNARGRDFHDWWSKWSEENIPQPSPVIQTRREKQNSALKTQSAKVAPPRGVVVERVVN